MAQLSPRMQELLQPHLTGIEPYDPNFTPTPINLSANENTYPLPGAARDAISAALSVVPFNRYPDPMSNNLRDELARWHGVSRDAICVGNGGDELLYNFMLAFGGEGRTLLTFPPDFSEYAFFASLTGAEVKRVWRDSETFEIDADAAVQAAATSNLVILTSPNNPTGNLADLGLVERICDACPGLVMVDEAYGEFAPADASAVPLLATHDNLVILKTLSKAFGAAGIRCGYVLAPADVIEVFAAVRQIYSVNVLTQAVARAAVGAREAYAPVVEQIKAERTRLADALRAPAAPLADDSAAPALEAPVSVTVWPSEGNFVLVRVLPDASAVRRRLRDEYGILVRDFSYAPGLENCLRITVGTPSENDAVIAALAELTGEGR